jgi:radical SAM superfamily enzyme YgiQ (UPF0313 family)
MILLAYPKIDHEKDYVYSWMPFSLLTIAKPLLDDDIEVIIFDGNQSSLTAWGELLARHVKSAAAIGISIMTGGGQIGHALELAKHAKALADCPPIVFGGPHVNVLANETLQHPLVDAVMRGPGQNAIVPFVRALEKTTLRSLVPGLSMKTGTTVVHGPDNPPRADQLGQYPWHLLPVERYVRTDPGIADRTLNYVSSQGCVYKCKFCYELTYEHKYSAMRAEVLLDDIENLARSYRLSGVKFYDADFFINLRRASLFARGLVERRLGIAWAASINPNDVRKARRLQPDLLATMANSGCRRLLMGVESGSDRVLSDVIQKEITAAEIVEVAEEIASHGIRGSYTFIVGFPGETPDDEDATYRLIDRLQRLHPTPETRVHLFAPYPGTPLYATAIEHGFNPPRMLEAWSRYDYYTALTPWTNDNTVKRAREHTRMVLHPTQGVHQTPLATPAQGQGAL